jgi:heme-degrading monooxygenase HmoA
VHARVFTYEGSPDEIDAAIQLGREHILPLEQQMEGFRGLIVLADREAQKLVSLTLWENEELMRASEESARMLTRFAAQSVGGKRRSIEAFDVALFELADEN